jgi:glutaminyl-peptide cyclotransferase
MALVQRQVAVGQRPAGSPQLRRLGDELRPMLPSGTFEPFASKGPQQGLRNIVGVLPGRPPAILIGAHYDSEYHPKGFVGANDSAAAHPGQIGDMILLDYIANRDARIPRETNSSPALWAELRMAAGQVGTEQVFPDATQEPVLDDHIPFLEQGVPSIDLIDFSYSYADTVQDTPDKLDEAVLDQVGETVAQLVINLSGQS